MIDDGTQSPKRGPDRPNYFRWLIAVRVRKSERLIRMTLLLAFLAPDLAKAATEGQLPRGFGIKRLIDLPMLWSEQRRVLGLFSREARRAGRIGSLGDQTECRSPISRLGSMAPGALVRRSPKRLRPIIGR